MKMITDSGGKLSGRRRFAPWPVRGGRHRRTVPNRLGNVEANALSSRPRIAAKEKTHSVMWTTWDPAFKPTVIHIRNKNIGEHAEINKRAMPLVA